MYSAEVFQTGTNWHLMLSIDSQVLSIHTRPTLIEVLGVASTLQIHVTNVAELPLTQYLTQGVEDGNI
jgi:hypothetical protein